MFSQCTVCALMLAITLLVCSAGWGKFGPMGGNFQRGLGGGELRKGMHARTETPMLDCVSYRSRVINWGERGRTAKPRDDV